MKILSKSQTQAADKYTIENEPISSIDLMERASHVFYQWFISNFDPKSKVFVFCGQGNNGGDGLAVSRMLLHKGFEVHTCILKLKESGSPDFEENLKRLQKTSHHQLTTIETPEDISFEIQEGIIIDALFGSGLDRPLKGLPETLVNQLNAQAAIRVAIDIPSGLKADEASEGTIFKADFTFSFERPKWAFFLAQNFPYVGYWHFASIGLDPDFIESLDCQNHVIEFSDAAQLLQSRQKFSHKGSYGHALIVGGSHGKSGAVILASNACLRSGAGLTTAHIPSYATTALHTSLPELMLSIDMHKYLVSKIPTLPKVNAMAIGPGMGQDDLTEAAVKDFIDHLELLCVWDADALNILSKNPDYLEKLPGKNILTPHPKEFERLFGKTENDWEQIELLRKKAQSFNLIIVLKGAHTAIAFPDGNLWWNNNGNPGMATGGSGDVLTGFICGFLAQNYSPEAAALLGVYLHGLAGDLALKDLHPNSILASDLIHYFNEGLKKLAV